MEYTQSRVFSLDLCQISSALRIPPPEVKDMFRNGVVASRFTEAWSAYLFGVTKHKSPTHMGSDAYGEINGERFEFAIRSLTSRGIKFQASKFIGSGRTCSIENLKLSIRMADRWLVWDIRQFPELTAYIIKSSTIEQWVDDGQLTPSGISPQRFELLIGNGAIVTERENLELELGLTD